MTNGNPLQGKNTDCAFCVISPENYHDMFPLLMLCKVATGNLMVLKVSIRTCHSLCKWEWFWDNNCDAYCEFVCALHRTVWRAYISMIAVYCSRNAADSCLWNCLQESSRLGSLLFQDNLGSILDLQPEFEPEKYLYRIDIPSNSTSLDIIAETVRKLACKLRSFWIVALHARDCHEPLFQLLLWESCVKIIFSVSLELDSFCMVDSCKVLLHTDWDAEHHDRVPIQWVFCQRYYGSWHSVDSICTKEQRRHTPACCDCSKGRRQHHAS